MHTTTVAEVGARSADLDAQLDRVLGGTAPAPDVAILMIGANDVTHGVRPSVSVRHLAAAVTRLREAGVAVVVGTCPDLGTVKPIRHPLRLVSRRWARSLAAAQTIAVRPRIPKSMLPSYPSAASTGAHCARIGA